MDEERNQSLPEGEEIAELTSEQLDSVAGGELYGDNPMGSG